MQDFTSTWAYKKKNLKAYTIYPIYNVVMMSGNSYFTTNDWVPVAAMLSSPYQAVQVASSSCNQAYPYVPKTAMLSSPYQAV